MLLQPQRDTYAVNMAVSLLRNLPAVRQGLLPCLPNYALAQTTSTRTMSTARVRLRKRLGQHLLNDPSVARRIVRAADLQPEDAVFEVGPGSGNLTVHLLEKVAKVYAVELDAVLYDILKQRTERLLVVSRVVLAAI